eukprot:scaffold25936_cov19-Tisochrysis_lutea.AAC.4
MFIAVLPPLLLPLLLLLILLLQLLLPLKILHPNRLAFNLALGGQLGSSIFGRYNLVRSYPKKCLESGVGQT